LVVRAAENCGKLLRSLRNLQPPAPPNNSAYHELALITWNEEVETMFNRRRLRREKLEIYLFHLILANRVILFVTGLIFLFDSIGMMFINSFLGSMILLPAIFLLLLCTSYIVALYTARLGAWIGTIGRGDD
jgi:hypothetical protein